MTRIDDVAQVLFWDCNAFDMGHARDTARALAEAGHLMPELPEMAEDKDGAHSIILPDSFAEVWWDGELGTDRVETFLNRPATPQRFRTVAYALLAAADYAERNH